jgi:hypothetical protein
MKSRILFLIALMPLLLVGAVAQDSEDSKAYLHWLAQKAESVGKSTYRDGKVGSRWLGDTRGLKTERALNYKIRATWFTPEVIRASARLAQLKDRLTDQETQSLVSEAEAVRGTVVMIELDPNEGSGVIPLDWSAFLQSEGNTSPNDAVRGVQKPELRTVRAFQGVMQRNYDYERFWVAFPLASDDGKALLGSDKSKLKLVVRIYNKEGTVTWVIPPSVRTLEDAGHASK